MTIFINVLVDDRSSAKVGVQIFVIFLWCTSWARQMPDCQKNQEVASIASTLYRDEKENWILFAGGSKGRLAKSHRRPIFGMRQNCIVDSRSKDSHFFQTNTSSENKKKEGYARVSCSFELWSRRLAPGGGHDGGMMCIIVCVGALIRISGWAKFSDRIYDIFGWSDVNYTFYLYIRRRIRRELHFFRTVMTSWTGYLETKVLHL